MKIPPTILKLLAAGTAAALLAGKPLADMSFADRWDRWPVRGKFTSAKTALSLEYCITTDLSSWASPTVIHGEGIVEVDSFSMRLVARVQDQGSERTVTFIDNTMQQNHIESVIKGCI